MTFGPKLLKLLGKAPVLIPVVMYHGPEGRWTAARRMEELFQLPGEASELWRELVPRFEYRLDNLTAEREEALRARVAPPVVVLTWLLLRSGASEQLALLLESWRPVLAEVLVSPEGPEGLRAAAHYLHRVGAVGALDALWSVLDSMSEEPRAEELKMPFKTPALEEARVKGLAQRRAEGVLEMPGCSGDPCG